MKIVNYYSKHNLDSALATAISVAATSAEHTQESIVYDRSLRFTPCKNANEITLMGVDFSEMHFADLVASNPEATIYIAPVESKLLDYPVNKETSNGVEIIYLNSDIDQESGESIYNDLSYLILSRITNADENKKLFTQTQESFLKDFISKLTRYNRFEMLTKEEVIHVYKNLEYIQNTLDYNEPLRVENSVDTDDLKYQRYVDQVRTVINRNYAIKCLSSGSDMLNVPVLNLPKELTHSALRLISYSYDDIVSYEDTAHCRVYRIYTHRNKDWYIRCIKPHDVWTEGNILCMTTDVPVQEAK